MGSLCFINKLEFVFQTNAYSISFQFVGFVTLLEVTILTIYSSTFRQCVISTYQTLIVFTVTSQFITSYIFSTKTICC